MKHSIIISKDRIVINEESLTAGIAIKLIQSFVDFYPLAKSITIDLSQVKNFSLSGLLVLSQLMDEIDELKFEGANRSLADEMGKRFISINLKESLLSH